MYLISESIAHVVLFDKGRLPLFDHKKLSSGNLISYSDCKMINDSNLANIVEVDPFLLFSGSGSGVGSDHEELLFGKKDAFDSSTSTSGGVSGAVGNSSSGGESDLVKWVWDSQLVKNMAMMTLFLWAVWMAGSTVQPTSRRLVNLTYVALCLFVSTLLLLCFYVVDKLGDILLHKHLMAHRSSSTVPPNYPSGGIVKPIAVVTLSYLSRYGLTVFLAANVLTGCVNTAMRTIYATAPVSLLVLTIYSLAVT
eukprot:gene41069-55522_t